MKKAVIKYTKKAKKSFTSKLVEIDQFTMGFSMLARVVACPLF